MTTRIDRTSREVLCLTLLAAGWVLALMAVATLLAAMASPVAAAVLSGSSRTSLYTREAGASAGEGQETLLLEHVKLDALHLWLASISLHGSFSEKLLLERENLGEARGRLYRAYARWSPARPLAGAGIDLRAGRHWVVAGVGTGVVDGLSLTARRAGLAEFTAFAGTLGAERRDTWRADGFKDSRRLGGRLRWLKPIGPVTPNLGVSFEDTRRQERADTQRLGLSASVASTSGLRLYGEWRRSLLLGRTTASTGGLEWTSRGGRGLRVYGQVEQRRPDLGLRSFFAPFESGAVSDTRAGLGARLCGNVRADVSASALSYEDGKDARSLRLTLAALGLTAGYRLHRGYGGDLSGLVLTGRRDWRRLTLDANLDLVRYQYGELAKTDDGTAEGVVSLGYRLRPDLLLRAQWEGLDNARFVSDHRFLGSVEWRFRTMS